ncbi:MAG: Gfo/Idh/MocA family oxidoreductase [bacterium]
MENLRFGILSTASVNEYAFLPPIKKTPCVELLAIASRDLKKAARYAAEHGIPEAYGEYERLLADPEIDCVFIPLPVSMHAEWAIRSLEAGKHVLCEKPVAVNADEARAIAAKVKETGKIFAEAFHYRYHPFAARVESIVRSGGIGEVQHIFAVHGVPLMDKSKVQFSKSLAGGALLDIGCYPVNFARWIAGCDEATVTAARAKLTRSGVDGTIRANLKFENGIDAEIHGSLVRYLPMSARIKGTKGEIYIMSPFNPAVQTGKIVVDIYMIIHREGLKVHNIRVPSITSYHAQLEAFCEAVRTGSQPITNADEAVANMRLLDAIREKAGL